MNPPPDRAGRRRLQALAGATVRGNDGKTVGRARDVYLHDATGDPAAISVIPRPPRAHRVPTPAAASAALPELPDHPEADAAAGADQVVRLLVATPTATSGVRPPHTLHATPQVLREAAAALRLGEGSAR